MTDSKYNMKYFPVFLNLAGRSCLVVGGGSMALNKTRLLLKAGAVVHVFASEIDPEFYQELTARDGSSADDPEKNLLIIIEARFEPEKISQFDLIVAASGDPELDLQVAQAANRAGRPVNVVDRTDLCTFIMPAIVHRGDVIIGISTSGASPVLARNIRAQIESILPARLEVLGAFARSFRQAVKATFAWDDRKRFWERFFDGPIASDVLAGREAQAREKMVSLINRTDPHPARQGLVHIVGAGPGDPDLLTLRAVQVMRDADVVLYDKLIGPRILDYVRRDAKRIYVGKTRAHHSRTQSEINALLVHHAKAGRRVVRLKGGDPFVFGRGGEELEAVRSQGIEVEVVPGVTAATGCAAAAQIPLTHRDHANAVTFVTGHGLEGEPDLDWEALARRGQTLVIYMGASNAGLIAQKLIAHGLDGETPMAIIENGTLPEQKTVTGPLVALYDLMHDNAIAGPAMLVIGDVAALGAQQAGQFHGSQRRIA